MMGSRHNAWLHDTQRGCFTRETLNDPRLHCARRTFSVEPVMMAVLAVSIASSDITGVICEILMIARASDMVASVCVS